MPRRLIALALLSPAILLGACGGPLATAEVSHAKITSTNVPFVGTGVSGAALGDITADLGPVGSSLGTGFTTTLTVRSVQIAWTNPSSHPDFSGVTSATLSVIPDPASGLSPTVVATYVQDPADPNPAALVIAGDPALNVFDYLAGGVLKLQLDAVGTPPAFAETATVIADLALKVEYKM
jgi:hypothetical protein